MRASNLDTHNVQGKNGSRILDSAADKSLRRTDDALARSQRARTHVFQAMNDAQVRSILAKTVNAALRDEFELFKTTTFFDVTAQNPAWLGRTPTTAAEIGCRLTWQIRLTTAFSRNANRIRRRG
jgi:hypothetical protein